MSPIMPQQHEVKQTLIYRRERLRPERLEVSSGPSYAAAAAARVSQHSAEKPEAKKGWGLILVIVLFLDQILGRAISVPMNSASSCGVLLQSRILLSLGFAF